MTAFSARWYGDKIGGLKIKFADDTEVEIGHVDHVEGGLASYTFEEGETLTEFIIRTSGYGCDEVTNRTGYHKGIECSGDKPMKVCGIKQIEFRTNLTSDKKPKFLAGAEEGSGGFDNIESVNNIEGHTFAGLKVGVWDSKHSSELWFSGISIGISQDPSPSPSPSM